MTVELSRRLLAAGVPSADIEAALFLSVARGIPMARALVDRGVVSERTLEEELSRWGGMPLRQVAASAELWARMPMSMCRRLGAVPLRVDAATSTVEVAAIDPLDPHVGTEFAFHLGMAVRVQRATLGAIEEAIRRLELGENESVATSRTRRRTPAFPHGAPRSSVPPPPAEEVPIPLVRRVSLPAVPDSDDELSLVTPRPSRAIATEAHQRAVSFPSTPPPASPSASLAVSAARSLSPVPEVPPIDGRASVPSLGHPPLAPRRTHTPALGSLSVGPRTPTRGAPTPPLGTIAAVTEAHEPARASDVEPASDPHLAEVATVPMPARAAPVRDVPAWATPSETLEDGFRRASGEIEALRVATEAAATHGVSVPQNAGASPGPSASITGAADRVDAPEEGDASEEPTHVRVAPIAAAPSTHEPIGAVEMSASAHASGTPSAGTPSSGTPSSGTPPFGTPSSGSRQAHAAVASVPAPETLDEALDRLGDAQGRDAVVSAALASLSFLAPRVAIFVAKRDGYQGWACSPEFGDEAALRQVTIAHKTPSILATAAAAGFYLGPVPGTPGHAGLLAVMRQVGPDLGVSVVRVAGKPAMVLVAEGLDDTMRGTRAMGEIARIAGLALSRVLSSR